jgi:SAM-dependent methyltransferase
MTTSTLGMRRDNRLGGPQAQRADMPTPTDYTREFFSARDDNASKSAAVIVPLLMELVSPRSVVDVGCGLGAWLATFEAAGVKDYQRLDGPYVNTAQLRIPRERFLPAQLPKGMDLGRTFDLALCLEVAEHLPASAAGELVDALTALAPVVAFSAAIPLQGGTGHVNEQWPTYWADLFMRRGYLAVDALRPRIWGDERVAWWYRQNALVFASTAAMEAHEHLLKWRARTSDAMLSLVHPVLLERRNRKPMRPLPALAVMGAWLRAVTRR